MSDVQNRQPVRFLLLSASLQAGSLNTRLAALAARVIEDNGGETDFATMREFDAASYDADEQANDGFPAAAENLRDRILASDAFVIAEPRIQLLDAGRPQERD